MTSRFLLLGDWRSLDHLPVPKSKKVLWGGALKEQGSNVKEVRMVPKLE